LDAICANAEKAWTIAENAPKNWHDLKSFYFCDLMKCPPFMLTNLIRMQALTAPVKNHQRRKNVNESQNQNTYLAKMLNSANH